jgi:hypothetical protein
LKLQSELFSIAEKVSIRTMSEGNSCLLVLRRLGF